MLNRFLAALLALLFTVPAFAESDDITRLYTFTPGTTIQSAQMNAEFNQLINTVNEKAGRAVDQTISGVNTFSGNNVHSGNATFSGTNTHSGSETFSHTSGVTTNTITERTSTTGVTVDGLLIKDGYPVPALASDPSSPSDGALWYNTTSDLVKARVNGSTTPLAIVPDFSGNGSKYVRVNSGATALEYAAAPIFTGSYSSSAQTITSGGALTLAHGLAGAPKLITAYIKCIDTGGDGGWEQNDEVYVSPSNFIRSTSTPHGFVVTRDATNIIIRFSSDSNVFYILNEGDGTGSNITNTKWQLYVQAYY
jgi:hypothetical protein